MFQRVRKHINPATIVALVALVFAVTGGAFAATGGNSNDRGSSPGTASASTGHGTALAVVAKKKSKSKSGGGSRGPAGPRGVTGAAGPTGPTGPTGATGATGATGPAGSGSQGPQGIQGEKGEKGETGPAGPQGPAGTVGKTLASGATETGTWVWNYIPNADLASRASISFAIPLSAALPESQVHFIINEKDEEIVGSHGEYEVIPSKACTGTVEDPAATAGNLCVYAREGSVSAPEEPTEGRFTDLRTPGSYRLGAGTVGAVITFAASSETDAGYGTWAVTAE